MKWFSNRTIKDTESWYAILVRAGREPSIKQQLLSLEKELEFSDLIVPEPHNLSDYERYKNFSGYIFLKVLLDFIRYTTLLQLEYVYRFLGSIHILGDEICYIPSLIPEEQISNVRNYLNGKTEPVKKEFAFNVGDEVEITSGDLASLKGSVISLTNNYACILPKSIFGQTVKVPVERVCVCS